LCFGFAPRLVNLTAWRTRLQAEAQKSAAENAPVEVHEEGLQHVCASYREALHINASHLEATAGLGETMLDLGRLLLSQQRLEEAHSALSGAGDLLFQYVSAREADETALHNLACVCSMLGRVDECQVLGLPVVIVLSREERGRGGGREEGRCVYCDAFDAETLSCCRARGLRSAVSSCTHLRQVLFALQCVPLLRCRPSLLVARSRDTCFCVCVC